MYELEEKRDQIFQFIDGLTDEQAATRPSEEEWSILETLEHLFLIEKSVVKGLNHVMKTGEQATAKSKPIHRTTDRSHKVEAPERLRPAGRFTTLSEAKDALVKSREATLFLVHNKDKATLEKYTMPHPAFGDMTLDQWVEFIGWHELRHLEQMKEVEKAL
ncbi:DinB family protein [Thalassobacillus hwangdonensis]|uniref:DinB family protein n=1 Tax=Thalassobacillus hwangdonensis TaxID=546108 RepID=A0ABW3L489_9BACI